LKKIIIRQKNPHFSKLCLKFLLSKLNIIYQMHLQNLSLISVTFQNLTILIFYLYLKQKTKKFQNNKLKNIYKPFIKTYLQVTLPAEVHCYKNARKKD
jgi:hypothetical protein